MRINTNVASLAAQEAATNTNNTMRSSLEKLGTGRAINKASDDGAGLAIADKLRTQASGLKQSVDNGNSAIAMMQIADRAMEEQSNILDTVKTKLIQASTETTTTDGMVNISRDIEKLLHQLNHIAAQTNYNGINILQADTTTDGSATGNRQFTFQMGEKAANTISIETGSIQANSKGLGLDGLSGDVAGSANNLDQAKAQGYLSTLDGALQSLSQMRGVIGSTQNQLESSVRNMSTAVTNIKAAESLIRDVDYAEESANFNKQNIIAQAGTYAMSQANAMQQNVQKLLQ
jgi:flagellin